MPFESEKQRRYMHANHPEIARKWEHKYGAPKKRRRGAKDKKRRRRNDGY